MKKFANIIKRLFDYTREELIHIVKDPALLLIFVIANIIYPLIYSYAYNNEQLKEVNIALVDLDNTATSRKLARMLDATEGVKITLNSLSLEEAKRSFFDAKVQGVILLPENLESDILSGKQSSISAYSDASYFLFYKQVYASTIKAYKTFSAGIKLKKGMIKGQSYEQALQSLNPISFQNIELYNPNASYGSFVMPSMVLVILQQTLLIGLGMLGGTRKEIIRYQNIKAINLDRRYLATFMLGKAFAYYIVFMIMGVFNLVFINDLFQFPHKTGYAEIFFLYSLFLIANIFLGMILSVFFKRRENSMLFMVFLSVPVLFLSGATWPVELIPPFLHKLAGVFPSTYMVPAYQRVRSMGAELYHVQFEYTALIIQCIVYPILAYILFKVVLLNLDKKSKQDA